MPQGWWIVELNLSWWRPGMPLPSTIRRIPGIRTQQSTPWLCAKIVNRSLNGSLTSGTFLVLCTLCRSPHKHDMFSPCLRHEVPASQSPMHFITVWLLYPITTSSSLSLFIYAWSPRRGLPRLKEDPDRDIVQAPLGLACTMTPRCSGAQETMVIASPPIKVLATAFERILLAPLDWQAVEKVKLRINL